LASQLLYLDGEVLMKRTWLAFVLPFLMGAQGKGCGGAVSSTDPAPKVAGTWAIEYSTTTEVDVRIGGAVYHKSLPNSGGAFSITHQGKPISFELDCTRPEVVCPSEVWPTRVTIDQREAMYPHRMWVSIPTQSCSGPLVAPETSKCGSGTNNPDCDPVCDGEITTTTNEAFGVINDPGTKFDLLLGGGVASNGYNCALIGISYAKAELVNSGSAAAPASWQSNQMKNGAVKTAYAGGCLWLGDPDMDGQLEALVLGATVEISTGFTGTRAP
jgi:hypothetical protein